MPCSTQSARILICAVALLVSGMGVAKGDLIIYGSQTEHPIVPGGDLNNVRLSVGLSVSGGVATMLFENVSVPPETSAVFRLIVLDTLDDDTSQAVLSNGSVVTNTPDVSYLLEPYNVLPGYGSIITDGSSMIQLRAEPPPPGKGIGPGELLEVRFDTCLPDGSDIDDYLAFFDGGNDTADYSVGFHAINASTVGGESLSGVPEPVTFLLLSSVGVILIARKRL